MLPNLGYRCRRAKRSLRSHLRAIGYPIEALPGTTGPGESDDSFMLPLAQCCFVVYEAFGAPHDSPDTIVPAGVSVELSSGHSLLHYRLSSERGRDDTLQELLAGDHLQALAFEELTGLDASPATVETSVGILSDNSLHRTAEASVSDRAIETIGASAYGAAAGIGAALAGVEDDRRQRLESAARRIGPHVLTSESKHATPGTERFVECCPPEHRPAVRRWLRSVLDR